MYNEHDNNYRSFAAALTNVIILHVNNYIKVTCESSVFETKCKHALFQYKNKQGLNEILPPTEIKIYNSG